MRTGRNRLVPAIAAIVSLATATQATAQTRIDDLAIQSDASFVQVGAASGVWLDLAAPVGSVFLPFAGQGGGNTGLRAALGGTLRVVDRLDDFNPSFQVGRPATAITPVTSGNWLPGLPGSPAIAAPASIAVSFGQVGALAFGTAALRDVSLEIAEPLPAEPIGTDRWAWPKGPFDGPLAVVFRASAIRGFLDFDAIGFAATRAPLSERIAIPLAFDLAHRGVIERSPGGGLRLTLPIRVTHELGPRELGTALPVRIALDLTGRIVAQNPAFVPEPMSSISVGVALLALARLARRRGGSR